jgi:hypothetical protein
MAHAVTLVEIVQHLSFNNKPAAAMALVEMFATTVDKL